MICFGKVDEFEIKGEGSGQEKCGSRIGRDFMRESFGLLQVHKPGSEIAARISLATCDCGAPQTFDCLKESGTGLLSQDLSEQRAERTDVAAKGSFLALTGAGFKFGKSVRPMGRCPKRGHN